MSATALVQEPGLSADELARALEHYLAEFPGAVVLDEGRVAFEMTRANYALSTEHGRCVLQLWSDDNNCVRTVVGLQARKNTLNVKVRRFGRSDPQVLQFVADRDTRTLTTRQATRSRFLLSIRHLAARAWSDWTVAAMRSAMDLEHSFGPAYARGLLIRGQSCWALIAVNPEEMPATIDGILTLGILWLHQCREHSGTGRLVEGLRVIVPAGTPAVTASRMAWLNPALAKWQLWEIEPQGDNLVQVETTRHGNLRTRLVRAFDPAATLERFKESIARILSLVPPGDCEQAEIRGRSPSEVALSLHGLEFARVRHGLAPGSFTRQDTITFGAGPNEIVLNEDTEPLLRDMVARLFKSRRAGGGASPQDALYRLQPERWLESALRKDLAEIEPTLNLRHVYSQVPAFAAADRGMARGMLDLLTVSREGRLAVLELKADEDLQLPFQGLDYWLRVRQLQPQHAANSAGGDLQGHGYFPGVELAAAPPLLYFVAPALRIHPANEIVLAYLAEEIDWTVIALNEDWRTKRTVIFRKHAKGGT